MWWDAYLHLILIRSKEQPTLRPCTRCSEPAMFPSCLAISPSTNASMRWSLYATRLKLGSETLSTAVLPTYLPSSNRYILKIKTHSSSSKLTSFSYSAFITLGHYPPNSFTAPTSHHSSITS